MLSRRPVPARKLVLFGHSYEQYIGPGEIRAYSVILPANTGTVLSLRYQHKSRCHEASELLLSYASVCHCFASTVYTQHDGTQIVVLFVLQAQTKTPMNNAAAAQESWVTYPVDPFSGVNIPNNAWFIGAQLEIQGTQRNTTTYVELYDTPLCKAW